MLIKDQFNINESDLDDKASESGYWESCENFYYKVKDKSIEDLTENQINWLEKIEKDLNNVKVW